MQLAILVAVLAALMAGEAGGGPVGGLVWRLPLVALAAMLAPLAAWLGAQRLVHAAAEEAIEARDSDLIGRLQAIVVGLWLSAVGIVLLVAQWPRIVRGNWQLANLPLVDELAILAPVIAPLLLVWAALYRLERAAQVAALAARCVEPPPARMWSYIGLHARHYLGLIVLPALVVIALFETLQRWFPAAASTHAGWLALPALAAMLLLMPLALRHIWRTTPLPDGELRRELEAICLARQCPVRDILVWHTDGYVANAAVVGISRWLRYVLITDALLARLSGDEIAAVVRHELGHLRRRHLPLRMGLLALPLAAWMAVKSLWPDVDATLTLWAAAAGLSQAVAAAVIAPAAMLAYAVLVVGWYSRLLEHEADWEACLDDSGRFEPQFAGHFTAALVRLTGRTPESRFSRWLHPSLEERLRFLSQAAADERHVGRFRGRLRLMGRIMVVLYAAAVALMVL